MTQDDDATIIAMQPDPAQLNRSNASLVIVQGNEIGKQFRVRRSDVVIGRSGSADVVVKDKRISRSHAQITTRFDAVNKLKRYLLADLNSTNHVYVNGQQISTHALQNSDKIQVGDTILKFEIQDHIDSQFHSDIQRKIKYDKLTSLLTYDAFKKAVNWELENTLGTRNGGAVLMMDLDHFKQVNDTCGHLSGSFVLQEVGKIILGNIRQFDIAARYGGEEFVVYLPDTGKDEALFPAERIRSVIEAHLFKHNTHTIRITISIGISHYPDHAITLDELIQAADTVLYKAKEEGRNRVYISQQTTRHHS
ncbi:MAG: GGDEF domain-containing protein [Deltaproteobacteria bacterium]|nr:GGDEF domain-containing protein [Deltaproteobacteria bacterium]